MSTTSPLAPFHHFPDNFDSGSDIPEPFGYTTIPNPSSASSALPLPDRSSTQSRNKSLETPKSTFSPKLPVYFNSLAGKVGLVCGRENQTKYRVLKNLLAASWKDREPHSCPDILCFTAENGSLQISQTIADLLQKGESGEGGQNEPEVIVLTWPSNLSSLRALHASSKNVKVHPLLVHPEDVKLEHLRHIYEGRLWGSQNAVFDDLLQGSRARGVAVDLEEITLASLREKLNSTIAPWLRASIGGQVYPGAFFFLDLNPHLSQQLDDARADSRTNPGWVEWILQGQPRSSGLPTVQGDYSQRDTPLLLCIDWTGCTPEERRVQNVLADIVLRQWVGYGRSQRQEQGQGATTGVGTIVCDNVHHYFSSQDQSPFTRSLSRLSYESILADSTPSPPPTNSREPAQTVAKPSHQHHNLLLLTESPIAIPPTLQDMSNFLILHRFTSPGWLTALEKHFHLHSTPSSSSVEISITTLLDQILDLDDKHVLLFAPPKPAFTPGHGPGPIQTSSPSRTSGSGGGGVHGTSHSPYFISSPMTTTHANVNGVIQRPKKQSSSAPTPVPIGRHLTKICFSKEDHSHTGTGIVERSVPDVNVVMGGRDDFEGGGGGGGGGAPPNFGVIGGGSVRRSTGDISGLQRSPAPAAAASSLSPYHTANFGTSANGFARPPRMTGMLLPQGGLTSSPSQSVMRDRSPHWNNAAISTTHHHQLPGSHSPAAAAAAHWPPSREENPNYVNGFPFPATPSSNPFIPTVNGYFQHQQRSPQTPPFIPINSSDAVITRPGGIGIGGGGGMGGGIGVPRRISPPSSSSASGMSFSFGNGNGHGMTLSSSTANQSSISTSFGMSPTSPVGAGFGSMGRGMAFSPFATPNMMLKTDHGEQLTAGLLGTRTAYSTSESSSRYFVGAEKTPQVTSFGSRPSPQPSSERHSRTGTTSTTGSRDDASSADYVEVSPGSDFSRGFAPRSPAPKIKDDMTTVDLSMQGMGNGTAKRSYAGVAAPGRETQRRDTVLPPPGKESVAPSGTLRPPIMTQTSVHSMTPPSSTDLRSASPSDPPPPPPTVYPEAFFWPLLDALEKSRAQVSTPHNRAQSVRHSVVGQELPPSARARLGLTFKEYVAAAARQGVIVTGDSGDKAWIAMREWKYPGKSYNTWPANR